MRILVIIPALNEVESITQVIGAIHGRMSSADVLVIDDGSTDDTANLARAAGAAVVSLPFNMGVGAALRTGFRYAARRGYDLVVQCDADGQHPADRIVDLVAEVSNGADLVIGSRFAQASTGYEVERTRGLAMRIIRISLRLLTKQAFTDPTSGFRAFSAPMIRMFATTYPREFLSDTVEALLIACYGGFDVREVPVEMRHREAGAPSHTSFRLMYQYVHLLAVIAMTASLRGRVSNRRQGARSR